MVYETVEANKILDGIHLNIKRTEPQSERLNMIFMSTMTGFMMLYLYFKKQFRKKPYPRITLYTLQYFEIKTINTFEYMNNGIMI